MLKLHILMVNIWISAAAGIHDSPSSDVFISTCIRVKTTGQTMGVKLELELWNDLKVFQQSAKFLSTNGVSGFQLSCTEIKE